VDEAHERMDVFKSGPGRGYLAAKYSAEEDRNILSLGNGVAVDVQPCEGCLVPWGVTEVQVTTYNNMSGAYADEVTCDVRGAPLAALNLKVCVRVCVHIHALPSPLSTRPAHPSPLCSYTPQLGVMGCPLSLRKECVGLDSVTGPLPTLRFGEVRASHSRVPSAFTRPAAPTPMACMGFGGRLVGRHRRS
jgi:hypothetical protein